jgi:hypothetical protein
MIDRNYGVYLSKKVLDKIIEKYPIMAKVISKHDAEHSAELERVRQENAAGRAGAAVGRGLIGKIVVFDGHFGKQVGLVYGNEGTWVHLYYMSGYGIDYTSAKVDQIHRLSDNPQLQGDYAELKAQMDAARQAATVHQSHSASRLLQVVGDHQPYEGRLPSDQQATQATSGSSTPRGWGSV